MAKKESWFSAVKKAIHRKNRPTVKLCRVGRCFRKQMSVGSDCGNALGFAVDVKLIEAENEQNRQAYSVALVTAVAAEAAVAAAHAAAEVVRIRAAAGSKSQDGDAAAVRIQAAFRGYLVRRELRAFRRLVRLQLLMGGRSLKRQAAEMQKRMQTMARVRSEVRARRFLALELGVSKLIPETKSSAWRHTANQIFMDLNNPTWGWNWLENRIADVSTTRRSARKRGQRASERTPLTSTDRDSKSMNSSTTLWHSIAGSSLRDDDDSLTATSRAVIPSYMASTKSTRAKLRSPSPMRQGKLRICDDHKQGNSGCSSSAKKRLSFSGCSSGSSRTRCSTPVRIDIAHSNDTL